MVAALKMPARWTALRDHALQTQYMFCGKRFVVVPAGRRAGKSEIEKRRGCRKAISFHKAPDGWFVFAAPTHAQAKRIYWRDIKALIPKDLVDDVSESELVITLFNGARVQVMGLDVPERIEGPSLDHICLDEYGNMREDVWGAHVRPALSDRAGTADFIGVPEGRNHYYDLWVEAQDDEQWGAFTWTSEEILPADEIAQAKHDLDPLTYDQEYRAHFISFQGRTYYAFSTEKNVQEVVYDPELPLIITHDFNVAPGTANVIQEKDGQTRVLHEVWIERDSNTLEVCARVIQGFKDHPKEIRVYGDATGGAKGTAKVQGSDWDLAKQAYRAVWKDHVRFRVPAANPKERVRVNAMNSRCSTADGTVKLLVDPACKHTIADFEGVSNKKNGSGDIDKTSDPKLTHLSDGIGYYVAKAFPISKGVIVQDAM